jgi:hypothetical protein
MQRWGLLLEGRPYISPFPPFLTIVDKELLSGSNIFDGIKNDQISFFIMPIVSIVLIRMVKDAAKTKRQ